ncbi:MAG TPA: hypothetical protein VGD84_10205, partial [Pseudonocardiaceae bacterium]
MVTSRPDTSDTTEAVWDEFLAVICADEEWVRAEFDALIAAQWPDPPPPAPAPRPALPPPSYVGAPP